jgi:RNA polymerase sigma-70 factor (ECF subfamily)
MASARNYESLTSQRVMTKGASARIVTMGSRARTTDRFHDLAVPLLGSLYNHAHWLVRDAAEAEDLVQETLTKALRAFDSFEPDTNFKAWIFRIMRNTFLSSRMAISASRTVFLEDHPDVLETADSGATPETEVLKLSDLAALRDALEELAPQFRDVILLCDLEELKYREIATVLDVPVGTVMSRLARARQMLRKILTSNIGDRHER